MLIHATVTLRLNYCNMLCEGLSLSTIWKLQAVQNGLLTSLHQYVHTTPVLQQFQWLPICFQSQLKMLIFTYKASSWFSTCIRSGLLFPMWSHMTTFESPIRSRDLLLYSLGMLIVNGCIHRTVCWICYRKLPYSPFHTRCIAELHL